MKRVWGAVMAVLAVFAGSVAMAVPATAATPLPGVPLAWGENTYGMLGDGTTTAHGVPAAMSGLTNVVAVSAGANHVVALRADGTVWAAGANYVNQLGDGTSTNRSVAVQVIGLTDVVAVSAGTNASVALRSDGTVWTWGYNGGGSLGDGTFAARSVAAPVPGLTNVVAIFASSSTYALRADGTVWAWGINGEGEIGDGTTVTRTSPVQVVGLTNIISISAGTGHGLAVRADGTAWAWGWNAGGQLGDGTTTDRLTPVQISGLDNVVSVAGGRSHSLAVKADGTLWTWGSNSSGQLGDGTLTSRLTPMQVSGLTNVVSVTSGAFHSFAARADGTVWSWGFNSFGQLGDGTTTSRLTPASVSALTNALVDAGDFDAAAVRVSALRAPRTLDFGSINVGGATTNSVTITNASLSGVTVTGASISGANSADFSLISPPAFPYPLAAGASLTLQVRGAPTAIGTRSAWLSVNGLGSVSELAFVSLDAFGYVPSVQYSAASFTWPSVFVGEFGDVQTLVVTNNGAGPLGIASVLMRGLSPGEFPITANTCPATLAVGASCEVDVVFGPRNTGLRSATLKVTTDAGVASIGLTGTGVRAADTALTLKAPSTAVHNASVTITATPSNYGPIAAKGITVSLALPAGANVVSAVGATGWTCVIETAQSVVCTRLGLTITNAGPKITVKATFANVGVNTISASLTTSGTDEIDPSDNNPTLPITIT